MLSVSWSYVDSIYDYYILKNTYEIMLALGTSFIYSASDKTNT